jgi:hypothetical protein
MAPLRSVQWRQFVTDASAPATPDVTSSVNHNPKKGQGATRVDAGGALWIAQ